jgi:hypothetical protein
LPTKLISEAQEPSGVGGKSTFGTAGVIVAACDTQGVRRLLKHSHNSIFFLQFQERAIGNGF